MNLGHGLEGRQNTLEISFFHARSRVCGRASRVPLNGLYQSVGGRRFDIVWRRLEGQVKRHHRLERPGRSDARPAVPACPLPAQRDGRQQLALREQKPYAREF